MKTQFNPSYKGTKGDTNNLPSLTVPDMNIGIKQLLKNHTRGISSNIKLHEPQYFETEIPNFIDQVEKDQYNNMLKASKNDLGIQIKEELAKKALERAEKKKRAEIEDKDAKNSSEKEK